MTTRTLVIFAAAGVVAFAPPAQAKHRTEVHPYLEVDQTVFSDLKNGGGTQAYTTLAAGIDASVSTPRAEGQISYRYEHRFGWGGKTADEDIHSGLARGRYQLVPNLLSFEAGALATRARTDIRGDASNLFVGNPTNVSQIYSVYAGPSLATRIGDLDVGAFYRFGYTKVQNRTQGVLLAGQPVLGSFDDSTSHVASAHVGMAPGALPFGWNVTTGYEREDAGQLAQRFESEYVRGDVTVPITPTVAAVGGVGYEKIKSSQKDALRDATGNPVVDSSGRFATDPASPRLLTYDQSGFIWDVGVLWRPSRRTSLEARVGRRYGSMTYIGSFSYQPSEDTALQVGVYDGIQTFGRQLNSALSSLPTQFTVARNPFGSGIGGCVFGSAGGAAGGCLNDALQSLANGTYRSRGINGVWRYGRGPWGAGVGVGYAERRFFAPAGTVLAATAGTTDRSVYAQGYVARRLDAQSSLDGSVYVNWYNSGLLGAPDVLGTGATGTYSRTFGHRLSAQASLGLYSQRVDGVDSSLIGSALLGARYQF